MSGERVIVVTGGASGIGKATALRLAAQGVKVVVADFNADAAQKVAAEIISQGGQGMAFKVDVSQPEQVEAMIDFAVEEYGTITGIFNNAGIGLVRDFLSLDYQSYRKIISVDQDSVYLGCYYAGKKMIELGVKNGVIVNTASAYAFIGVANNLPYCSAKAAVVNMTRTIALELAPYNIRVVGVAPGPTETSILDQVSQERKDFIASQMMRKKLIQPEKIASVVCFLFSEDADAINGFTLPVDDGQVSFKS